MLKLRQVMSYSLCTKAHDVAKHGPTAGCSGRKCVAGQVSAQCGRLQIDAER